MNFTEPFEVIHSKGLNYDFCLIAFTDEILFNDKCRQQSKILYLVFP